MSMEAIIYIVEDNDAVRDSLEVLMASKGFKARAFASGGEFLQAVTPANPGCLLIDFQLPDLDGLAVIAKLKARNIRLPVILITGHSDQQIRRQAEDAGVVGLVLKPFAFTDVMARVETALALSEHWGEEDDRPADSEMAG